MSSDNGNYNLGIWKMVILTEAHTELKFLAEKHLKNHSQSGYSLNGRKILTAYIQDRLCKGKQFLYCW